MVRLILSLALLACLFAPGARAQATADQLNKLSLEALTAPPPPGSGGGWAPARHSYARHYAYAPRHYSYAPRHYASAYTRHSYARDAYARSTWHAHRYYATRRSYGRAYAAHAYPHRSYARAAWHPHRSYAAAPRHRWAPHRSYASTRWGHRYHYSAVRWNRPMAQRHFVAHWTRGPQVHHVAAHRVSRYTPKFYRRR